MLYVYKVVPSKYIHTSIIITGTTQNFPAHQHNCYTENDFPTWNYISFRYANSENKILRTYTFKNILDKLGFSAEYKPIVDSFQEIKSVTYFMLVTKVIA